MIDSFVLLPDASLAASRTLLKQLLACLNFTLDSEDFFYWYKRKKWFLWNIAAAKATENHGHEWGLTWYLRGGLYTSIPSGNHSQNSPALAAAEAPSLKISSKGTFFNCYLAAPRPTLNNSRADSLTHPTLITAFELFRPEGHREAGKEVGSLSPDEHLVEFEHLSNDHKDHPNQHENSQKLCNETRHPVLSLTESWWKLRPPHDQNFSIERKRL